MSLPVIPLLGGLLLLAFSRKGGGGASAPAPAGATPVSSTSKPPAQRPSAEVRKPKAKKPGEPEPTKKPVQPDDKQLQAFADATARALQVKNEAPTPPERAAELLKGYIVATGDYGVAKPSPRIAELQQILGVAPTGIIDQNTRSRCMTLGVQLPGAPVVAPTAKPPAPAAKSGKANTAVIAAQRLQQFLDSGKGSLGAKGQPSKDIADGQRGMAGLAVDGIYGPATQKRSTNLGVPLKDRAYYAALRTAVTKPAPALSPVNDMPPQAITPKDAAKSLISYLDGGGDPGKTGAPSQQVAQMQKQMGGLTADGIYGPKTQARAKSLGQSKANTAAYYRAHMQ